MQAVVVHAGDTAQALRSPAASRHLPARKIGDVLLPSPTLSPKERIAVYQQMYPLRMHDALAADYPGLEHFLGHHFQDFVMAYTKAHPSRRYTLNRLGDHVPAFLARQRRFSPRPFLLDLARLELALTEAFDEQESPTLKAETFEAIPPAQIEKIRLQTVPSVRLVALSWNAEAYLDSVQDENHNHPKPSKQASFVLAFRRSYALYRLNVSAAAFAVLEDVVAGKPIGDVVRRSLARRGSKRASVEDFSRWFRQWTAEGVFAGVKRRRA
ncbi:MAG: putative DNA-binding domain-containing protein [Vicinamibacteria bacterium]|nr:putative DNA-binding domain-containing protein [Vicinamibacteria bacterium]